MKFRNVMTFDVASTMSVLLVRGI